MLQEVIDPNYHPTDQEVAEYAKWLGMDMEKDVDLFWIAKEGLEVLRASRYRNRFASLPCSLSNIGTAS